MSIVLLIYIVLMIVFLVVASLIFRHTVKYSYLSPKFNVIVSIFGLLSLGIIIFSLYLVFQLFSGGAPLSPSLGTGSGGIQF